MPNKIAVQVSERTPVVAWNDAGRTWWLSLDGLAFIPQDTSADLVQVESSENVLSISEAALIPAIEPEVMQSALELSQHLSDVEVLQYDPTHGFGFEDSRGWTVYFGKDGDMAMKMRVYRALAETIAAKGISVTLVNLENQAAPYYQVGR